MKRIVLFLSGLVFSVTLFSQEKMYICKSDKMTLGALITGTDSIYFSNDGTVIFFRIGGDLFQYQVSAIDSVYFGANSTTVDIRYNGNQVYVVNPLAFEGVSVGVSGADVTVTSTIESRKVNFRLNGTTSDGMFRIYSNFKFDLEMNGVNITNTDGPAINIQSDKKCTVTLAAGTNNSLTDGTAYSTSTEDQKGTFFSEGQLELSGTGNLQVRSISKHAICSDDYIDIENGTITVIGAGKDGIHSNDYFKMSGGTLNVTSSGDGIECEGGYIQISDGVISTTNAAANVNGISCDSTLTISGGTISMTVSGNQSKGIKATDIITLSGGNITVNTSGGVVLETSGTGYDPAYCAGIKSDKNILISGSSVAITSTGTGGKGITASTHLSITGGTVNITTSGNGATYRNSAGITDSYNATCLSADGNVSITGGSVTLSSSGTGGKGINVNGTLTVGDASNSPTITITTSGGKFVESGSGQNANYNEPKALKCDGAIAINNGNISISSNDDGIKSGTSITISNATVSISKCYEALEAPYITVNSGNVSVTGTNDGFNATKGNGGESNDGSCIYLNGGYVVTNISNGDGLDSNGNMEMKGGTVVVHGPQGSPEVGADFNGTFNISGGMLVISGTNSNMTEGPGTGSSQYSVIARTNSGVSANTLFHMQDGSGNDIVTFKPYRNYYSVVFSSSALKTGTTYTIYTGGTCSGTVKDGLYTGGTYSGGTSRKTFTLSSKTTNVQF